MEKKTSRFEIRLPKTQKEFFGYAANLGGYRTLTEFVIFSAQSKADEILKTHNAILVSKRDQEIFFEAIIKSPKPGKKLNAAVKRYNKLVKQH